MDIGIESEGDLSGDCWGASAAHPDACLLYTSGSLLPLEVDRNECWLTPQPILEGVTDMASTGRRLLVQKGDSSLWRMGWWEGYQYQPLEKWMDNVVYFTADLAVTGDHTLWYLASDTPSMIMNNVACAVNGEQGILALDWDCLLYTSRCV